MSLFLNKYQTYNPADKTVERATELLTDLLQNMSPLVNIDKAKENKRYLFGNQDNANTKKMFRDPINLPINLDPVPVFEKTRNILISEMEGDERFVVEVKASDALASNEREKDRDLLANRNVIEAMMSGLQTKIGMPPYKMSAEKKISGKKLYSGNVEAFDKLGLDASNPQHIDYFMDNHYRLDHEVIAEEPINALFDYNDIDEKIALWVNDILSNKAVGMRVFVSDESGALEYRYISPETVSVYGGGLKRDYTDAFALSYTDIVPIHKLMEFIGNEFDPEVHYQVLLNAVNFSNKTSYTGIGAGNGNLLCGTHSVGGILNVDDFMRMQISLGYVEWKETDETAYKVTDKNYHGNFKSKPARVGTQSSPDSIYRRKSKYAQNTWKAYYIMTSSSRPFLFKFGKLSYQPIEGAEDEKTSFSILIYKEIGITAMEIIKPYIDFLDKNMKKFEYMVVKAKPPGRGYNYESLVEMAKNLYPDKGIAVGIEAVLELMQKTTNEIYTYPNINGNPIGGGVQINYDIPNGLSKSVLEFKSIIDWAFDKINEQLGMSPLRNAYSPQPRDGYKLQEQAMESSMKATDYIPKILKRLVKRIGRRTLLTLQDIIKFKDRSSLPYRFLLKLLGDKTMEFLETLDQCAHHRYGLNIQGFYSPADIAEKKAIVAAALQKGEITYDQWVLIDSFKSPKKAIFVLAFEKVRNQQQQQQNLMQIEQVKAQTAQQQHANKMEEIKLEGDLRNQAENTKGMWIAQAARISSQTEIQKQQMKVAAEPEKIAAKKDAEIEKADALQDMS